MSQKKAIIFMFGDNEHAVRSACGILDPNQVSVIDIKTFNVKTDLVLNPTKHRVYTGVCNTEHDMDKAVHTLTGNASAVFVSDATIFVSHARLMHDNRVVLSRSRTLPVGKMVDFSVVCSTLGIPTIITKPEPVLK